MVGLFLAFFCHVLWMVNWDKLRASIIKCSLVYPKFWRHYLLLSYIFSMIVFDIFIVVAEYMESWVPRERQVLYCPDSIQATFKLYGPPENIVADGGKPFVSEVR